MVLFKRKADMILKNKFKMFYQKRNPKNLLYLLGHKEDIIKK